jgi:hypothetical protein
MFTIPLPKDIRAHQKDEDNDTVEENASYAEKPNDPPESVHNNVTDYWGMMKERMNSITRDESQILSQSIWKIRDMFNKDIKGEEADLLLQREDMLIRMLRYV